MVKIEPTRLSDPALAAAFSVPFYAVKITTFQGGGTSTQGFIVTRLDSQLVSVDSPGTDDDSPKIQKFMNSSFRLRTDQDAAVLQHALDIAYPIVFENDRTPHFIMSTTNGCSRAVSSAGSRWDSSSRRTATARLRR